MKRFAISFVAVMMILYSLYALGPNAIQDSLSTRTLAQEQAAPTGRSDPFSDPSDSARQTTPSEPTLPKKRDQPKGSPPRKTVKPSDDSSSKPQHPSDWIEARLSLEEDFEFPDVPLQDIVDGLSVKLGVPIVLDKKALEDAGIGADKTVNFNFRGMRSDKFLDLMLGDLELAWVVRDGYVLITTKEKLSELLEVRVYNCSDLIEMVKATAPASQGGFGGGASPAAADGATTPGAGTVPGSPGATPAGGSPGGFFAVPSGGVDTSEVPGASTSTPHTRDSGRGMDHASPGLVPDYDSLIEVIQTSLEPDTWTDAGGSGSIESYHGGLLVINQDGRTHRRIELLLNMMRQAKQAEPGTVIRER